MHKLALKRYSTLIITGLALASVLGAATFFIYNYKAPIKIGILHSLTGDLAISEKPMVDAELMAIEEINQKGGIGKRKLVPIVVDGKSDEAIFAKEAERLIKDEQVAVIVGSWTSAARKAVKPVVEKYNNLLLYPVAYEGLEESENILYTGTTQNQQIMPSALWSFHNLGKRFFLVGSQEVYSYVAHAIIKDTLKSVQAEMVGESFMPLGSSNTQEVMAALVAAKPEVIINTIQGESNLAFFQALRAAGITPEKIPVMSVGSVTETEFAQFGANAMAGDYVTASYFQSIDREENSIFVSNFKKKFGADRVISEAMEAGYFSIHLWAQAVATAKKSDFKSIKKYLYNQVLSAPEGIVYVDNTSLKTWKMIYVGKLRSDGQFTIVWDSAKQVQPQNFPRFKEKDDWKLILSNLYEGWGNRWSKITG